MAIEDKLAAQALRAVPELRRENQDLKTKLATYERRERVDAIYRAASQKQVELPDTLDLMKCSEEELKVYEKAITLFTPSGAMKLGSAEEPVLKEGGEKLASGRRRFDVESLLLDPQGFEPTGDTQE